MGAEMSGGVFPTTVDEGTAIYKFKVTLNHFKPAIWRRVEVPGYFDFSQFAQVIIQAMGWHGGHLHEFSNNNHFRILNKDPNDPYFGEFGDDRDAKEINISDIFSMTGMKSLKFTYDMGDNWQHKVLLEAVFPAVADQEYPVCTAGRNACPPEDCGSVSGYANLLEAIKDPNHREHKEMKEWLDFCGYENFDPKKFNKDEVHFFEV
ncbi:uncharacterized protein LOC114937831 [Nylanderia fulva]|uniref:uncharacterized protein LOC114937831 n=1 Tax=Nylanderia fulva TaxID=613905 RepID=UPI0010FAF1DC|nr:uncharacterized protein LOC114937831 [Nylanderia fulva]XP_029167324.1 uncharacterized protein LOC114937831 [Nylanderia fulva]XP_029167325.1 uncharacterized protein LOC114937831 [Nylanderia fulva]XP_029167326.1 uncharacterized protein LOC114937831 [Nylanderia fulva]